MDCPCTCRMQACGKTVKGATSHWHSLARSAVFHTHSNAVSDGSFGRAVAIADPPFAARQLRCNLGSTRPSRPERMPVCGLHPLLAQAGNLLPQPLPGHTRKCQRSVSFSRCHAHIPGGGTFARTPESSAAAGEVEWLESLRRGHKVSQAWHDEGDAHDFKERVGGGTRRIQLNPTG
jgi:hypothetical protein